MAEFWESNFREKNAMWGFQPEAAATYAAELFAHQKFRDVLIPGFGYGRNAVAFIEMGMQVTGIEISATAIEMARRRLDENIRIFHGPVGDMPFSADTYDGIFCHALIHLLDQEARRKLLADCHAQLRPGGLMVFTAISTRSAVYGQGTELSRDYFETPHGVRLFFYDAASVEAEFGPYGLREAGESQDPRSDSGGKPAQVFWQVTCGK